MATELEEAMYSGDSLPAVKAAVLLVIGEPVSIGHKDLILAEISKGFLSWDAEGTGVDINEELASIANAASAGEEGPEAPEYGPLKGGERVIRRSSAEVQVEILINPQTSTVRMGLKTFMTTSSQHKHLIYAGHGFQGSGAWVLQDDIFTFTKFVQVFRDPDVENALRQQQGGTLSIHCFADGEWSNGNFSKQDFGKILKVSVNPAGNLSDTNGILRFVAYVGNFVEGRSLNKLLQASDVVGNIRFSKPTLYVFPGCQGDSALFGISGFNLLINGGYNRKACFWDFTRHLDRIDAMLLTHLGPDNLFGIGSVLERKAVENVHPEIGYVYLNAGEKTKHSPNGDLAPEEGGLLKASTLKINLAEECSRLIEYCKQIGQAPHPCTRSAKGDTLEPINLYHKVGHGSLDMYVLNPIQDSKEIKEYFQQFSKHVGQFGLNQGLPLQNVLSTCALLVWKPSNPKENITRILFPGNAPQNKIIEGLEKVKNLDFLKHAKCCDKDLHTKPGKKGSLSNKAGKPISGKPTSVSAAREPLRKEKLEKTEKPRVASSLKANKGVKEDTNKKAVKEKKEKQKPEKSVLTNGTPASGSTPSSTPVRDVSPPSTTEAVSAPALEENLIDIQSSVPGLTDEQASAGGSSVAEDSKAEAEQDFQSQPADNFEKPQQLPLDTPVGGELDSPEPLPDPASYQPDTVLMPQRVEETMAMVDEQVAMSKKAMEDLGIYDEDAEFPEDGGVGQEAAVENSHENNIEKAEVEEPEEDIGAFENDNPEAEEIQPEALPEPVAVPSYYESVANEIPQPEAEELIKSKSQPQQEAEILSSENIDDRVSEEVEQEQAIRAEETTKQINSDSQIPESLLEAESQIPPENTPKSADDILLHESPVNDLKARDFEDTEEQPTEIHQEMLESQSDNFERNISPPVEAFKLSTEDEVTADKTLEPLTEDKIAEEKIFEPSKEDEVTAKKAVEPLTEDEVAEEKIFEPSTEDEVTEEQSVVPSTEDEITEEKTEENIQGILPSGGDDTAPIEEEDEDDDETTGFENEYDEKEAIEQQQTEACDYALEAAETEDLQAEASDDITVAAADNASSEFDGEEQLIPEIRQTDDHDIIEPQDTNVDLEKEPKTTLEDNFMKHSDPGDDADMGESSIPAAFEKDDTPELGVSNIQPQEDTALYPDSDDDVDAVETVDHSKEIKHKEETDSLDGEPDDEKDVDEACFDDSLQNTQGFQPEGNESTKESEFGMSDQQMQDYGAAAPMEQGGMNPFFGIDESDKQMPAQAENPFTGNFNQEASRQPFNPLKEWGEPMGLPSPMMEEAASNKPQSPEKSPKPKPTKTMKNGSVKTGDTSTAKKTDTKRPASSKTRTTAEKRSPSGPSRTQKLVNGDSKATKSLTEKKTTQRIANSVEKKTPRAPSRPATAPGRTETRKASDSADVSKARLPRRPASTSGNKASAPSIKTLPLPAITPFYVDLTYIPAHGDPNYSDVELFRRVRARYYVLSALSPTSQTLNSLMEAKRTWDDSNLEVTVIPTYDNETLRHWMGLHKDELNDLKIDVAPAASRCTIQLQDHETSCSAYRLEF